MKLKTLLLPLLAAGLCANAFAAPPSDASLEKWMEVQHFDREFRKNFESGFYASSEAALFKLLAQVPNEKQKAVKEAAERYRRNVLMGTLTPEQMRQWRQELKANAKQTFSQEEIDGMTAFYSTPVGQSILEKSPAFMQAVMQKLMAGMQPQVERVNAKYAPEFYREVERIMCTGKNPDPTCAKNSGKNTRK